MLITNNSTEEMIIWLRDKGRSTGNTFYQEVANRLNELEKLRKENDT